MKLTLYLLIGSIIALIGVLAVYFSANSIAMGLQPGQHTFDLLLLQKGQIPIDVQRIWFLPIFIGFGVLAGIWPFHNWSPDGHVAAPTAVSMIHAGVLMKLGAFAALMAVRLLPDAAKEQLPFVILLVTVNVVYGAGIAMVQKDFKYVIGFSSVSHMGLVTMGFATMNQVGMNGAVLQMWSHGIMTACFFSVVGLIYDRAHTRQINELSGWARYLPLAAVAFIIGGLVSMGMPGFSGFVAEFQIFMGLWTGPFFGQIWYYPIIAILAIWGVILTAAYVLRIVQQVIKVIVHVVYKNAAENISDAQIRSQITVLNRDFRATNPDKSKTPLPWKGLVADSGISFVLDRVTRTQTTKGPFTWDDKVKKAATGGIAPINPKKYLNLWVCALSGGLLGYAQFPGGPQTTDGVVINYSAFGTMGTAQAPFNKGRTATHEIGHWLNLFHIWGDDRGACSGSDQGRYSF